MKPLDTFLLFIALYLSLLFLVRILDIICFKKRVTDLSWFAIAVALSWSLFYWTTHQ